MQKLEVAYESALLIQIFQKNAEFFGKYFLNAAADNWYLKAVILWGTFSSDFAIQDMRNRIRGNRWAEVDENNPESKRSHDRTIYSCTKRGRK